MPALAEAIEDLYRVFAGYRLAPHVEGCPHCVTDADHARLYRTPLRSLETGDLERYAFKAMTTWGDARDFRHFLPRILELLVCSDLGSAVPAEIVLGKLADAGWKSWPEPEAAAVRSVLRLRWSTGLASGGASFDADEWLCGIAYAGDDVGPYLDEWQRRGAASTLGHVAAFLEGNPELLTRGKLGNAFWSPADPQTAACAETMRTWLSACFDDPVFQAQLAAQYSAEAV